MPLGIPDDELPMQQREAEESQRMNEQKINLAIAEACGWRYHESTSESGDVDFWAHPIHPTAWSKHDLPPYASDLNAMHEAEMSLPIEGVNGQPFDGSRSEFRGQLRLVSDQPYHATALQRAEAFLRTIGKFTPTPTPEKTSKP